MCQWTRRLNDKAYVSKWNWQFRLTVYTRCHRIDSAASISRIFGQDNSHSSIIVSIQSRIHRNPAKGNAIIGDRRCSRNDINISILFSSINIGIPRSYQRYPRFSCYNITNRFPGRVSRRAFAYPKKRYHGANLWNYAYVIPTRRCGFGVRVSALARGGKRVGARRKTVRRFCRRCDIQPARSRRIPRHKQTCNFPARKVRQGRIRIYPFAANAPSLSTVVRHRPRHFALACESRSQLALKQHAAKSDPLSS